MSQVQSDEDLMIRLSQGDHDAFSTLYDRYRQQIMAYIRRLLLDHGRAEECFQETFARIYRSSGRYDPTRPFRPWLYRIATNICYAELTRYVNRITLLPEPSETLGDSNGLEARISEADAVRTAMAKLTQAQRSVVILHHYQGLSYVEIAAVLSIPLGTVKSRMSSALASLRADLLPSYPERRNTP